MIREIMHNALKAKRKGKTLREKLLLFQALNKLSYKLYIKGGIGNSEHTLNLLNYKITGFNYYLLDFLFNEVFIGESYNFITTKPSPVIIDCGANVGFSVLFFKRLYPQAIIHAFEPNPNSYKYLEKNVSQNALTNTTTYNLALSDKEETISFYVNGEDLGTLVGSIKKERGGDTELKVKAIKLSHFIKNLNAEIDMLKIDVEGAEINIIDELCDAQGLDKVKEIIIEYHHKIKGEKGNLSGFLAKLEKQGFDYNISSAFTRIGQFQDILIHLYR